MPPGLQLSYGNPRLMRTMFLQLQQQQLAGLFCDLTLKGEGQEIHVHSCLLAACSPYLTNLLGSLGQTAVLSSGYQNQIEISRRVLNMPGFSSNALFALVRYMYTSELTVSPSEVHEVLTAARILRIPELEVLNLENGRLVRSDAGRRINRESFQQRTVKVNSLTESSMNQPNQTVCETSKDWLAEMVSAGLHKDKLVNELTPLELVRDPQSRRVMAEENRAMQVRSSTELIPNPHDIGDKPSNIVLAANETSSRQYRNTKVDYSFLEQQGNATNQNLNKEGNFSTVRQTIAAQLSLQRHSRAAGPSRAQESGTDKGCENQFFRDATVEQDRASVQIRVAEQSQRGGDGTFYLSKKQQERSASNENKLKQDKPVVDLNQERHCKEAKQNKDSPSRSESWRKALDGPITAAMLNQGRATMAEISQNKEAGVNFPEIKKDNRGGALLTNQCCTHSLVKPQSNLNRDQKNPPSQTLLTQEEDNLANVTEAIQDKEGSDIVTPIKNCGPTVTKQTKETLDRSPVAKLVLKKKTVTSLSNQRCMQEGRLEVCDLSRDKQVIVRQAKQSVKHSMSSVNELNKDEHHDYSLKYCASLCNDKEHQAGMLEFGSKAFPSTVPETSHDKVNRASMAKSNQGKVTESSPHQKPITESSSGDKSRRKVDMPVGMERRASEQNQANDDSLAVLLSPCKNELVHMTGLNQWKKEEATITKGRRNPISGTAEIEKHGTALADENEDKEAAEKSTKRQRERMVAEIGKHKPRRDVFNSPSKSNQGSVVAAVPNRVNPESTLTVESPSDQQKELEKSKGITKRETTASINTQVKEEKNGCEEAAGACKLSQWKCETRKDKPGDSTVTGKDLNEPEVELGIDKNLISTGHALSTNASRQRDHAEENILLQQEELMGNQDKELLQGKYINIGTCRNQQEKSQASRDLQGKGVRAVEERKEMVAQASRGMEICSPKIGVHKNILKKSAKMEEHIHLHPIELTGKQGAVEASKKSQSRTVKRGKCPHVKERKVKRIRHEKAAKLVQDQVTTAGNVEMQGKTSCTNKGIDHATGEKTSAVDVDLNGNRCLTDPTTKTKMAHLNEPLSVQKLQFPKSQTIAKPSKVDFGMSLEHSDQQLVESNHSGLMSEQNQSSISNTNAVNQIPKHQQRKVVCAGRTQIKVAVNALSERRLSVKGEELEDGGVLVDGENLPKQLEPERTLHSDTGMVHPTTCSLQDSVVKEINATKSACPKSVTHLSDEKKETQNVYSIVSKNEAMLEPSNLDENGSQEKKRCWSSVEPDEGVWVKESRSRNIEVELFVAQKRIEVSRSQGKDEHLSELEDLLEQMLNDSSTSSPELDVGRYSPAGAWCVGMRPDLSSGSDTEVDVLD